MASAIHSVRLGAMSRRAAAKTNSIPKTTLLDKLTEFLRLLYQSVENLMCEIGYPVTHSEFLKEVERVLDIDCHRTPFQNNLPGKDWFSRFCKGHPQMSVRKPMSLAH